MVQERLCKLRNSMQAAGMDCYLIPTSDYHDSEYVSSFFMVRKYFSGFTGSAGTLVVRMRRLFLLMGDILFKRQRNLRVRKLSS